MFVLFLASLEINTLISVPTFSRIFPLFFPQKTNNRVKMKLIPFGIISAVFVVIPLYCGIDPFHQSAISGFPEFKAHKVDFSAWSLLPTERDLENLLHKSEIRFRNKIQGPETIAFDIYGRGPYTGVADGRILSWNGQSWTTFAYASPNR